VKLGHNDSTRKDRRLIQIDRASASRRGPLNHYLISANFQVDPAAFFVALDRVIGLGVGPRILQSLSHDWLIQ